MSDIPFSGYQKFKITRDNILGKKYPEGDGSLYQNKYQKMSDEELKTLIQKAIDWLATHQDHPEYRAKKHVFEEYIVKEQEKRTQNL